MRFQEQRIPSTAFSQHLQSQDQLIRENLNFAGQTNRRMKEDIQAARRKLNSSSSTGLIRNNAFFQHTENNRNLVNVQQRPNRSNNFSDNLTPQYNTQSQFFRKVGPEVPEEADEEFEVLRREIVETRKQNEGLRQVITQNDASARFAISQLQNTIDAVRAENQRIKISYELLSKQNNDQRSNKNSTVPEGACSKCQKMERRIKELQDQLAESNQQLDRELKKRAEANQTNSTFRSQLSERLRSMEEKLLKSNEQILKYESLNFELTRKLSESQQREFYFTEQLNTLSQQLANTTEIKTRISFDFERIKTENERLRAESEIVEKRYIETINQVAYLSSKVEAINAEIIGSQDRGKADLTVGLGELQERVGELRYKLEEKITQNREYEIRIAEKDASMKKLSEQYGDSLEKIEHIEQALAHYRQSNEELQAELARIRSQESPASQQQIATQQRWEEAIHTEYAKVQNLNQQLQQKDENVNSLRIQLQEIHNYVHTVTINSQKTVQELNLTITHLYQQNQAVQRKNQELEAIVSRSKQEINQNSFDIVREREEILATREEIQRKTQAYEEALQDINYQQERNIDLEENIYALKAQLNNNQASITDFEQRLASSEAQRWRLESFITELNIKVRRYQEQNAFFVTELNEYRHRIHILEQEVIVTKRIIKQKQEIILKKDRKTKDVMISQNKQKVFSGQDYQNVEGFYEKKLFQAERYIQQMHQNASIQQQALTQQNQEIESLKGDNLRYKQIIDEITLNQTRTTEEISRNEVVKRSLQDKLSQLQPLLRQESQKNSKAQQTIEIQHEEIERLNGILLSKDSELQLIKQDFTALIDEHTEMRGHRASVSTNNDYSQMESTYRKKIESLQLEFNGWTQQLNNNLQVKQDEINRLTSELTLLRRQGNLQTGNILEDEANEDKLFNAERYIEELMHINVIYQQDQQERQQQIVILQEKLRNIEPVIFELQKDNKNLREIVSKADSIAKTQPSTSEITVLENRIKQSEERLNSQVTEGNKLKQAIEVLSDQLRQQKAAAAIISNESKTNQEKAVFFEQKLVDAETFISQLFEKQKEYIFIIDNHEKVRHDEGLRVASLSEQLQGALRHIEELTVSLDAAKKEAFDRAKQNETVNKQIIILQQQLISIQSQNSPSNLSKTGQAVSIDEPAEDFRERFEAAQAHIHYLQNELGSHLNTIKLLHKEADGFKEKTSENEAYQKQISNLIADLQGAHKHIEQIKIYSKTKEDEISYLTSIIQKSESQLHNQPKIDQPINQANQTQKNQLDQANQQIKALHEAEISREQILTNLTQQNEFLKRQLSQYQQTLTHFKSQNTNLLKELANAETTITGQKSSKDFLASKLEEAQTHIRYLEQELPSEHLLTIEKLQKYMDEAEQKAKQNEAQAQEQISSLTFQLHNFQQQINELENVKNQLQQLYNQTVYERDANNQALVQKQAQIESLQKLISELQRGTDSSTNPKISELQTLAQNNANQAANFENKLYEAEAYIQQLLAKEQQYVRLDAENNDIKGHLSNLEQSLLKSQTDNQNLASKLAKAEETIKSSTIPAVNQPTNDKSPENEALLRDLKTVSDEKEFFRIKLLDAEEHIHYLTHELPNQHLVTITKLQKHLEEAESKVIAWEKNVQKSGRQSQAQMELFAQSLQAAQRRVRELEVQKANFVERLTRLQALIAEKEKLEEEKNTFKQQSSSFLQQISKLQGELDHFQRLSSTQQITLKQYETDINNFRQQNIRLNEALAHAEEQMRKISQIQSISEERLRSRESDIINLSSKLDKDQTNTSAAANEEVDFLKNKLIEAQAYLVQLEDRNALSQGVIAQKEQELQTVGRKIIQAEDAFKTAENRSTLLTQEIESIKKVIEQLRENTNNFVPKSEVASLETHLKQGEQKLQSEITEGNKLRKAIETLSEQLRQQKTVTAKTTIEIQVLQDKNVFLQNKILQAENYIGQLKKKETAKADIKENVEDNRKQTEQLNRIIDNLKTESERFLSEVKAVTDEREFFKGKLNDAEAHINYLQNELVPVVEASKKELAAVKETAAINEKRSAGEIASLSLQLQGATQHIKEISTQLNAANIEKQTIMKQIVILQQQIFIIQSQKPSNDRLKAGQATPVDKPAEDLKERLEAAESHIHYLESELSSHMNTIQVLYKEVDEFKNKASENQAKERQISSLTEQLQGVSNYIVEINVRLEASKKEAYELAKENDAFKKQAKSFELQLSNIQSQKQTNEFSKTGQAVPAENLKERLEAAEAHIRDLQSELGGHLNTIQILNKEVDDFKKKASENEAKQRHISNLSAELQGALKHIEELTDNLQVQEKQVYRLSLALTKAASSPQVEPTTVLQTSTEDIERYKANLAHADQQIKRLLEENAAKGLILSTLQKDNKTTKEQVAILNNQLVNSQTQKKVLSDTLAKAEQAAKDQGNASNQDKEFFKHKLADAEEHIAYLESHRIKELENIIQQLEKKINETDKKTKADAQNEGKNQPQIVALTKKITELEILAGEREKLQAEKNTLQMQNAEASQKLISLQEDKDTANERANYSENLLMETIKQLEDLKQKMKDAEDYIYNVQTENNKLKETFNASVPSESIYTLPEYVSLEEKVRLLEEQNQRLGQIQEAKASSLEAKVDAKQPVEDAAFFKSKLLEAERYIEEIEHINLVNQQIINQQNDDISNFGAKAAHLEVVNADLVKDRNLISSQLMKAIDTNNQLKEAVTSLASPEKLVALENAKKQADTKLALKIKEALDLTSELNSHKLQNKKKDDQIDTLKAEKEASVNEAAFFKQKLFDAESYITAIEEVEHSNQELSDKLKKFAEIQDQLESLKTIKSNLSKQAEAKSLKITNLEKAAQQLSQQGEFFKRKLLDAETHIKFLEEEMANIGNIDQTLDQLASAEQKAKQWQEKAKNFENRNKELALMNHQLLKQLNEPRQTGQIQKLEDSLVQLKSRLLESEANNRELLDQLMEERSENSRAKVTSPDRSDFFKEKLLEAESYIHELEEQNGVLSTGIDTLKNQVETLKEECKEREKILVNFEEQINNYAEDLRESEVEKEALQLRNIELEQKIDPLTKKVQIQDGQLAREQEVSNKEVQALAKKLETTDAKLKEAERQLQQQIDHVAKLVEEKQQAQEKASKYENLSNTLQETLNLLDGLHKPFSQQEESIEQLKEQLSAAEKREEELKTNNATKDNFINCLQGQIEKENVDNQQLREKINNLLTENASLRAENDELSKQIQSLRQVDIPVADNSSLLRNLQQEQDKYNQMMRQLEQLTDRIKQTEEQNFQMKSLKDIAEKKVRQTQTIIRVLEEKVKSERYIPVEDEDNKIEKDFMDEKLREAEELITQQQNQINRLTQELIQQQNQSLKYSGDLTSKIEEENNLNNVVKELSNSRRLLDEKIRNLQIENEAIKIEKLEQSKQLKAAEKEIQTVQETISVLLDEKAVADDLAEVSKKELQNLEERYTALLSQATQLKESLQQRQKQTEVLENAQNERKVDRPVTTEYNNNKDQLYQVKINEIEKEKQDLQANNNTLQDQLQQYQEIIATLNGQIVEKQSDKLILQSEKEKLSIELTNQLSKSSQLEQQKEQSNLQLEQIKERQNGLKSKLDNLEKELENGNNIIEQLLNDKEVSEQKIADLQKTIQDLKTEKNKEIQSLLEQVHNNEENITKITSELQAKNKHIQLLNNQINPLNNQKEQLLKRSGELQQEIQALRAEKEDANLVQTLTARLSQAEDYIAQLEEEKDNANQIFQNLTTQATSMKEEVEILRNDLNNSVAEKQRLADAISDLQNEIQMAQSDNQRLTSKVSYLQSVNELKDKEIADLSEFSVNKEQNPSEKSGSKPEGISNANILPDQNKESNDLETSKKLQDQQNTIKQLEEQIRSLNTQLQSKEETIRQLTVENVNINDENKELQEKINDHNIDNEEQLRQHLVQADRTNFELQEENKQLLNDLQLLAKDKAYLQGEINQLKAKERLDNSGEEPKTPEKGAKKTSKPVSEPKSEGYNISLLQEEIEQLKQQLAEQRIRGQELLSLQVDNDALKHSKQQLEDKLEKAESERLRLVLKLKDAQEAIVRMQDEYKAEQQHLLKEKSELEENLNIAEKRINRLEEKQQGQGQGQASLGENLKKILDLTKNFNEEIEPQDITQHLQNYPYLNELITSILYRLRLSTALELEKSIKIKQLTEELAEAQKDALEASDLRTANDFLRRDIERLEEELRDKQTLDQKRYEEVLEELVFYETLNKELQGKMKEISEQYQLQKQRLDGYERQINTPILDNSSQSPQDNDLSRENYELRRKLQSSERAIQQFKSVADSSGSINTKDVFYLEFLNTCLDKVVDLQRELQEVERDIEHAAALETSQRNTSSRNEDGKGSDSALQDKLQELEDKLLKNAQNIREHQQRSDNELFELLKELSEVKELPQFNKNRIDDYLTQLENQILKDHEQHINEVSRLRDQLAASQEQSGRSNQSLDEFNKVNKEKLLKEINNLNNTIEIYHQQSMRRKKNYKRTIESLLRDIEKLKERQETLVAEGKTVFDEPLNEAMIEITDKLRYAIQKDEEEDSKQIDLGEDDFIISNNYVQILDGREKDGKNLSELQENFGEYMEKNVESVEVQTQEDHKPFLSFILSNQNLDKEDIRLLKKKIADMRAKEVQENLQALRAQEKKLEEVLMMSNRENPQQLDNIILTLANNYSRDEISQIFGSEDQDEILNKLNEALCMEDSFYKGENSSTMMKDIQERMLRHYESPTKLSEQVYTHLINLLSAKKDDEFYDEIQLLFRDLFEIQAGFEQALRKKDELYRVHNERMNQIFNRSSSDGSEEYLTIFQRENNEDPLQMHSQRKPRTSQHEDEVER